jgi:hypothetical protein
MKSSVSIFHSYVVHFFNCVIVSMYLSLILCKLDLEQEMSDAGLMIVYTYLEELHKRVPLNPTPIEHTPIEEDSQTYGSESGFAELANPRSRYIEVC